MMLAKEPGPVEESTRIRRVVVRAVWRVIPLQAEIRIRRWQVDHAYQRWHFHHYQSECWNRRLRDNLRQVREIDRRRSESIAEDGT